MIRFVIAIRHDPHEELVLFFQNFQNALPSFFPLILKSFAFYALYFHFFFKTFAKWHVDVTHAETPISMAT